MAVNRVAPGGGDTPVFLPGVCEIAETRAAATYLGGAQVYAAQEA